MIVALLLARALAADPVLDLPVYAVGGLVYGRSTTSAGNHWGGPGGRFDLGVYAPGAVPLSERFGVGGDLGLDLAMGGGGTADLHTRLPGGGWMDGRFSLGLGAQYRTEDFRAWLRAGGYTGYDQSGWVWGGGARVGRVHLELALPLAERASHGYRLTELRAYYRWSAYGVGVEVDRPVQRDPDSRQAWSRVSESVSESVSMSALPNG